MPQDAKLANGVDMLTLGERIRRERLHRHLSLEDLADRSQVSMSMLSAVERGVKIPTVLVLDRIATGLHTSIARLVDDEQSARVLLRRARDHGVIRDPSGWERRILSPTLPGIEFEFMRTTIPAGVDAGVFLPHAPGSREYVAVESGTLLLTLDATPYTLAPGDSIYYAGDCQHAFANPDRELVVYYVAMDVAGTCLSAASHTLAR